MIMCATTFAIRIIATAGNGMSSVGGIIVKGGRDEDGLWDLDKAEDGEGKQVGE